ncbi:hypothetical protein GCM10027440_10230 [Nocardiopsis coralliicola]
MIRRAPRAAADLLAAAAGEPLPDYSRIRCDASDASTTAPVELRVDSLTVCEDEGEAALAIITEVQRRTDAAKKYTWPEYVTLVRGRLKCPVRLLVLVPDRATAAWAGGPIDLGCGQVRPIALDMDLLQPITDPEEARAHPELAVLAAAHQPQPSDDVLDALLPALVAVDESATSLYSDYVLAALPAAARKYLEDAVNASTYEYKTELFRQSFHDGEVKGKAEGKVEGKAELVLDIAAKRGIALSASERERIASCTDPDQLSTWALRAATAATAGELFA